MVIHCDGSAFRIDGSCEQIRLLKNDLRLNCDNLLQFSYWKNVGKCAISKQARLARTTSVA